MIPSLNSSQSIGIFDSGIGGLTVANAIIDKLPNERIVYFGDTAHLPYGDKSPDAIRYYCLRIAKFLLEKDCKMIVVACNSASTAAYRILTSFFKDQVHFINVVDPLVKYTAQQQYHKVGVIATKATTHSGIYPHFLQMLQPHLNVFSLATPLLAPMIEEGYISNNLSDVILDNYLSNEGFDNIEAILLACTHYPLIRKNIEDYFEQKVNVLDSTDIVASAVEANLSRNNLLNPSQGPKEHHFYISDYTPSFEGTAKMFYQHTIHLEHAPIW